MKFRTVLLLAGKTATGVRVPDEVVAALGSGKRPPVRVTIGGHTYRSTIAVMGGVFMLGVNADNRKAAGVAAGEEIDVEVELDTEPREVAVPPDLAEAFNGDAEAEQFFTRLSNSHKKSYTQWIEGAKKAETRQRRVAEAITMLRSGRAQK